ncbi:MAG: YjbH domain-containing protein, partial [Xenophilus sp.]
MTRARPPSASALLRLGAAALLALAGPALAADASGAADVRPGERLSQWLLRQPGGQQIANPGLAWQITDEEFAQRHLKNTLLVQLETWAREAPAEPERSDRARLLAWVAGLPVTGRVALGIVDPRWLEANPTEDPVLGTGQRLVPSAWPLHTVAVVLPDGRLCRVPHVPGRNVLDYLTACGLQGQADWAWLAQPDGRTAHMGVAPWNAGPVDEPAPGAWLWAAPRRLRLLDGLSEGMIKFLATQGPSPQEAPADPAAAAPPAPSEAARMPERAAAQPRPLPMSANDWGEVGLLQTPSARMEQAGNVRATYSNVYPYSRITVMYQPFDWMEGGFRYSSISNKSYGITDTQSYKDKSIDLKLRLLKESAYLPQVALGFRDFGGTGLFSSEYFVASKRWYDLDFSLGIGWGYLGHSGNITNPFTTLFGSRFATRPSSTTTGEASLSSLFRGPAALFGGVQWQTPWNPLTLKFEYDGNDYQSEPLSNNQRRRSPFNVGLSYRVSSSLVLSAGFERGDKVMLGLSLSSNLAQSSSPKLLDPPLPRLGAQAPLVPPGWAVTAAALEEQTEWTVTHIAPKGDTLHVWATDADAPYREARVQRAVAVLHAAAPENIRRFVLHFSERGLPAGARVVERAEWVAPHLVPQTPRQARVPSQQDYAPASTHATPAEEPAAPLAAALTPPPPADTGGAQAAA